MYKVFYNNRFILIRKNKDFFEKQIAISAIHIDIDQTDLKLIFSNFIHRTDSLILETANPKQVFEKISTFFDQKIIAAGGIVHSENDEILVIKRNHCLDLPKGMLEIKDASIAKCAMREVIEETGVENLLFLNFQSKTYHAYLQHDKLIMKETHWFKMYAPLKQIFKPQTEEGIEWVKWLTKGEIKENLKAFWPSLLPLLQ